MRTAKCLAALVILSAIATTIAAAHRRVSDTVEASCLVRITANASVIQLNRASVEALVLSSGVAGQAAQDILGLKLGPEDHHTVKVEWLSQGFALTGASWMRPSSGYGSHGGEDAMMREEEYLRQEGFPDAEKHEPEKNDGANFPDDAGGSAETAPAADTVPIPAGGSGGSGGDMMMNDPDPGGARMGGFGMMGEPPMHGSGVGGFGGMGAPRGYGGGMGMGSMGMMGGYGRGMYGDPPESAPMGGLQQDVTIRLSVHLKPAEPVAQELLKTIVENLRQRLEEAHEEYEEALIDRLEEAERRREYVVTELTVARQRGASGGEARHIRQQLDTVVDLSVLSPEMPFSEAIEALRNSVEPTLEIAVLWQELLDDADIAPDTPITLDPLHSVQLRTALGLLLTAVTRGNKELIYRVNDNVIVVSTAEPLDTSQATMGTHAGQEAVRALYSRRHELTREIRNLELELAGMEARREAIQTQIARAEVEADQKLAGDPVTKELNRLVETATTHLKHLRDQVEAGRVSGTELLQAEENLTRARIELVRRREELSKTAGVSQLDQYNSELSGMAIDRAEKRARLDMLKQQVDQVQRELAQATKIDPRAARIRRQQQAMDVADRQILELQNRLTNLQVPTVTMIGLD